MSCTHVGVHSQPLWFEILCPPCFARRKPGEPESALSATLLPLWSRLKGAGAPPPPSVSSCACQALSAGAPPAGNEGEGR
jgi:hypothetical protein